MKSSQDGSGTKIPATEVMMFRLFRCLDAKTEKRADLRSRFAELRADEKVRFQTASLKFAHLVSPGERLPGFGDWKYQVGVKMSKFRQVPVTSLGVGAVLSNPVVDSNNPSVRLLSAGLEITSTLVDKLVSRGINDVIVSESDLAAINAFVPQGRGTKIAPAHDYVTSNEQNENSAEADEVVKTKEGVSAGRVTTPLRSIIAAPENVGYEPGLRERWAVENNQAINELNDFFADSGASVKPEAGYLRQICDTIISRLIEDRDALVCFAATPINADYPTRHGLHVAAMAIAIGAEIGLDRDQLIDLGIGCLIHDQGMKSIGTEFFETQEKLSANQLRILSDHPVRAIALAGKFGDQVSPRARLVAYQIHERCDGSGYPRGCSAEQINTLAKIGAVADCFVGMSTPRKHRYGAQGHFVVKKLLEDVQKRKLDPTAVRALLQLTSLFPVGSFIRLSGDHVGRVIRGGGSAFDKPTIEMWSKNDLVTDPVIVNLKQETELQVLGSIPTLDS